MTCPSNNLDCFGVAKLTRLDRFNGICCRLRTCLLQPFFLVAEIRVKFDILRCCRLGTSEPGSSGCGSIYSTVISDENVYPKGKLPPQQIIQDDTAGLLCPKMSRSSPEINSTISGFQYSHSSNHFPAFFGESITPAIWDAPTPAPSHRPMEGRQKTLACRLPAVS